MLKKSILFGGLALLFVIGTAFTTTNDKYFEIIKNIEIFTNVYKELNTNYVDDIDPGQLMRTGLESMVSSLDPFTNYISEADIEGYRFQTEGRYHGIGARSEQIGDYITITELYRDQPADAAGLRPGDRIISVDGESAVGRTMEEMESVMRGFPGSTMNLVIERPGQNSPMSIALTRGDVNVPNVPYSGVLEGGQIGYINLSIFTRDAGRNIKKAFQEIKAENEDLKGLVLDLRGNGGGLLAEAINICNIFLPREEVVVTTRGKVKDRDRSYKTTGEAVDTDIPLIVLIDKSSASASEIVSGVMQDYDRGVLVGQRSYGKGLVQNTMDIGYNARVKITTAKYYIPSERCIQSVEYENGEPVQIPDESRARFKTRNGRTVLDGGGVKPDVLLKPATDDGIVKALVEDFIIFNYVTDWVNRHPTIDSVDVFDYTDFGDFESYLQKTNFMYDSEAEKLLQPFVDKAKDESLSVSRELTALKRAIDDQQSAELNKYRDVVIDLIEKEIVGRYYYRRGKVQMGLRNDPEVAEAIALLNDPARYQRILDGQ